MDACAQKDKVPANVLTEKQLEYIKSKLCKPGSRIVGHDLGPATERGLAGFLGDHMKLALYIKEENIVRRIYLFLKLVPISNQPKAEFIVRNKYFQKESLVFKLLEEIQDVDYIKPWCIKALIHNEKIIVMPDLSVEGYRTYPIEKYFDQSHVFAALSSLARFHAFFANCFTKKIGNDHPEEFLKENSLIISDICWERAWLRAGAKLTHNIFKEFLPQYCCSKDLEDEIWKLYAGFSEGPRFDETTLNVVIHKDLWANNIMFQYSGGFPTSAVLVDFQLIRYAPPAYDLMSFLYLTTSRKFRESYEKLVLQHYFAIFLEHLDCATKKRLSYLNYDNDSFLSWCEKARSYGVAQANLIFPYVLLEPTMAQKTFDDPETYMEYLEGDRSRPVLDYARKNNYYRHRLVEACEELLDRYVLI